MHVENYTFDWIHHCKLFFLYFETNAFQIPWSHDNHTVICSCLTNFWHCLESISARFCRNSEESASEFLENLKEMFLWYYMYIDVCSRFNSLITFYCANLGEMVDIAQYIQDVFLYIEQAKSFLTNYIIFMAPMLKQKSVFTFRNISLSHLNI